jgi:hypothetical protein
MKRIVFEIDNISANLRGSVFDVQSDYCPFLCPYPHSSSRVGVILYKPGQLIFVKISVNSDKYGGGMDFLKQKITDRRST